MTSERTVAEQESVSPPRIVGSSNGDRSGSSSSGEENSERLRRFGGTSTCASNVVFWNSLKVWKQI